MRFIGWLLGIGRVSVNGVFTAGQLFHRAPGLDLKGGSLTRPVSFGIVAISAAGWFAPFLRWLTIAGFFETCRRDQN